jgi:hypothetical protein
MGSRNKGRPRERQKKTISRRSVLIGVAASLVPASCATPGEAPPIDYDAAARDSAANTTGDGNTSGDSGASGDAALDAEPDSTLVDLDGEADSGPFPHDAGGDHDAGRRGDASLDAEIS